ncbi:MAG: hypothetical protein K8T20_17300 [Planctomycetes bacterium]|nr:hypothetical protein [Planctomycetota bacterium]
MVKMMWGLCLLLVAIVVVLLVRGSSGGAPPGEWGELTSGSAAASAKTLLPNAAFEEELLNGWAHRPHVIELPQDLHEGTIDKHGGRSGGAFKFGAEKAKHAEVAATFTREIAHCDYFFDGYARAAAKSGKGWYGIELLFEDSKGARIASYLSWRGLNGGKPPALPGRFMDEMAPDKGEWTRIATHTSHDLQLKGLEMPRKPQFMTVNLWLGVEDGEASAWYDDLDVRDMKVGR